jgi:hypothetical protein
MIICHANISKLKQFTFGVKPKKKRFTMVFENKAEFDYHKVGSALFIASLEKIMVTIDVCIKVDGKPIHVFSVTNEDEYPDLPD